MTFVLMNPGQVGRLDYDLRAINYAACQPFVAITDTPPTIQTRMDSTLSLDGEVVSDVLREGAAEEHSDPPEGERVLAGREWRQEQVVALIHRGGVGTARDPEDIVRVQGQGEGRRRATRVRAGTGIVGRILRGEVGAAH